MTETRRKLTSFLLATTIIFGGSTIYYAYRSGRATRTVQDNYQQSINQLMESLAEINTTLKKVGYSKDDALLATLAAEVWTQSEAAKAAMSGLPLSNRSLEECETFIARTGDYAYYLLRSAAYGQINEDAWATLSSLSDTASNLYSRLDMLKEQVDVGVLPFDAMQGTPGQTVSGEFSEIESQFPEYAQLIYDGPFSEHIQNREPLFLKDKAAVTEEDARLKAARILDLDPATLSMEFSTEGRIPSYVFLADNAWISVTKAGGLLLSVLNNRQPDTPKLSEDDAVSLAENFLKKLGYENMEPSYYLTYEGVVTVNFAYTDDNIVYYPDLVQVGVSLDDGSILRFDAAGYLMNHHSREEKSPVISVNDARNVIPPQVAVQRETLAIIPTDGQMEKLCYAFTCEHEDGQKLLYYVNAETGHTENLFILVDTGHGTLTM